MERADPIQIAHVLTSWDTGGAEIMATRLAVWQKRAGNRTAVVSLAKGGPLEDLLREEKVETYTVIKRPGFDLSLYPKLAHLFQKKGFSVIHTHNSLALIYAAPVARLLQKKVVHTKHGDAVDLPRRFKLRRWAALFVHAFVSVSKHTDRFAAKHCEAPFYKRWVIVNGVEPFPEDTLVNLRSQLRQELGIADNTTIIGTMGRLHSVKNHAMLLRSVSPFLCKDVKLIIIGNGSERENLENLSRRLACAEHIYFLGHQDNGARFMPVFDIFALSSRTEGQPLALLEAMAARLPVVATAVGGIPEIIDNHTGILVPPGDEKALSTAIETLLSDSLKRHAFGGCSRKHISEYHTLDRMGKRYMELYYTLVKS